MFRQFVEANRQTGSTTSLAEAAIKHGAYLVVPNVATRRFVLKRHPELLSVQVVTLSELRTDKVIAQGGRQIFVDPACLCEMR